MIGRGAMERVYISGPITGEEDYRERFAGVEEQLRENGFIPVNPVRLDDAFGECVFEREGYLLIDLALIDACDAVYMLEGWEESRGANREYGYALGKGKKIVFE